MHKTAILASVFLAILTPLPLSIDAYVPPLPVAHASTVPAASDYPVALRIPSLDLNDPIESVGVDETGAMAVPDGATQDVGWWDGGTVPGDVGSAVLDAHVFAAFAQLKYLQIGSDIYVTMHSGAVLHFVVEDSRLYALAQVPRTLLFNRADAARLNLITCAGSLTPDRSTYDQRLIVYTRLVE